MSCSVCYNITLCLIYCFSLPEPLCSPGELIVYPCSGVRSHIPNIFSSETAWPIKSRFHVEPPWAWETEVCINGPGNMTEIATMPIYGKNLQNLLLQNQQSYGLETWQALSGIQTLQGLYTCK